ncbi:hypothetical protein [Saccharopolyspora flava]|uniref:Uncharacterized protein n=1 Tax=Saccharopolyspora flava TaxID=95161 RepID=A0A1I6UQ70_9PSEU|nr:hypothetical protein [Saccharopolyspora flava]SFT03447.1 hypothetical protein SAMN05660874_05139 [Saccharopolyspora flava]
MRSLIRPIVVGAFILPLAFAGAGLASAGETATQPRGGTCHHFACNHWWTNVEDNDTDTSVINAGIMG